MKKDPEFDGYLYYIMSAYVKFMEAAGAQVVPILPSESEEEVRAKLNKLNGVLFPGGSGDYWAQGKLVFEEIQKINDEGTFYPLWTTCQGYEYVLTYTSDVGMDILQRFPISSDSLPLSFTANPYKTRMFEGMGESVWGFTSGNYTYNSHSYGISTLSFETDNGLKEFWDLTSVSFMPDGTPFSATIEAKNYPIFGTQFHPEKPSELWVDGKAINHSYESIQLQRHFSELFIAMTRANGNSYGSFADTKDDLIANAETIMTARVADAYVFK